jgi:AraC-like DNA-binding protein
LLPWQAQDQAFVADYAATSWSNNTPKFLDDPCQKPRPFGSKRHVAGTDMEVLAEVMSLLRTKGQLYGRIELSAQWRMVRAASMMREKPSMKMAAIAPAVGYESESSFGKVFRRVIGVSPGKYRQKHQSHPRPERYDAASA